ncbi:MAG: helix-turn-helix domain-containing protein [Flavobacteriaceae bacterium]
MYIVSVIPEESMTWLIGPFMMLYVKSLFIRSERIIRRHIIHFMPFFFYTGIIVVPSWLAYIGNEPPLPYLDHIRSYGETPVIIVGNLYLATYILIALRMLLKYKYLVKLNYSTNEFSWIHQMLIGSLIVIAIDFLTEIYVVLTNKELVFLGGSDGYITLLGLMILVTYLGYYGVNQSKILIPEFLLEKESETKIAGQTVTDSPTSTQFFSDREQKHLKDNLERVLEKEKPYLDEDLTLGKLASLLQVSDKKLSTFLNQNLHINFYDLINQKRVQTVKEKIADKSFGNYTLLGIAFDSGFKSKTSFNRIFKKETGLSPSEYKAKVSEKQ